VTPERIRAAIRLLYPDEMTPIAKRVLEKILGEMEDQAIYGAGGLGDK
jgi:hypothetical protein